MADGERQILALKAAIQQRDSLLRIISGEEDVDAGEPVIADNPAAPVPTRLRNLQKQLKERDDALERAGSVADEIVPASPAPAPAPSQGATSNGAPTSDRVMPQKVSRPSWLARPDPGAGGDRLKARLAETDERFSQLYRQQQALAEQQRASAVQQNGQGAPGGGAQGHFPILGTITPTDAKATRRRGYVRGESSTGTRWSAAGHQPVFDAQPVSQAGSPPRTPAHMSATAGVLQEPGSVNQEPVAGAPARMSPVSVGFDASVDEQALAADQEWDASSINVPAKLPPEPRSKSTWHLRSHQQMAPMQDPGNHLPAPVVSEPQQPPSADPLPPTADPIFALGDADPIFALGGDSPSKLASKEEAEATRSRDKRNRLREKLPRIAAGGLQTPTNGLPDRVRLQDEERLLIAEIEALLDRQDEEKATFGDIDILERLVDYLVGRENELFDAIRQISQRDEHLKVSDLKLEKLLHDNDDLRSHSDRLAATQEELSRRLTAAHENLAQEKAVRIPPDPGKLYAREDHLRVIEELEDTKAQLDHWKGMVGRLEEEVAMREEQLVIATENLSAVQDDRTRIQKDLVALAAQLSEAEQRALEAQREATEAEERMRAEVDLAKVELQDLQSRFDKEVGHMVEKEARLQHEQAELLEQKAALQEQSREREMASMNQMGDATIKIETQEQELRGLRTRVKELELLLVEQQDTLDRLIADAMGEVGKRETEWLSVRNRKDARILSLEENLREVRMEEKMQHERADEYERQFRSMEDDYRERINELQARFDRMQRNLTRDIEMQKRDFKTQFEVAEKRAREAQERDTMQRKQISELLQQKAWLQRQMGLPEIVA